MSTVHAGNPGAVPILTDGVATLRGLRAADLPAVIEYAGEPQLQRWTAVPQPYTRRDAESFLATAAHGWAGGTSFHFALQAQDRLAGIVDLRPQGSGLGEIGFGLMAWARGRGLMTRALRQLIPWAFDRVHLDVLHWRAEVGNWPSRRVAWAVGFRVEGMVPGLLEYRGSRVDGWIAALRPGERLAPVHPWFTPAPITGAGVHLREHRDEDAARMAEACQDPATQTWLSAMPCPYTEANAREHLRQLRTDQAEGRALFWAIASRRDDRLLGEIALFIRDLRHGQAEIGYWVHPDARGAGVATEAVRLAVRHALLPAADGGLGMHRMLLRAAAQNLASQAVARRAGFAPAGVDRQADRMRNGTVVDDVRFDLLADELPPRR